MQKIKRSTQHALVWAKPMTQIGKELGISMWAWPRPVDATA